MNKLKLFFALFLSLLLLTGCALIPVPVPDTFSEDSLTVHFIDVGQADCALLECNGEFMLIDGGNVDDSSLVVSYLQRQGVEELTAVVCSHGHEDHAGGLAGVMAVFPVQAVYAPTRTYSSACFDDFMYYVNQQNLEIIIPAPGDRFALGDAEVTVLGPVESYADINNTSLVLSVTYGENSFLFTGDMELEAENDLLDYYSDFPTVDVLKVGHHGSSTSTGYRFLYTVDPAYAVISVGAGNDYGHPHREVVSRLTNAGIPAFRTDMLGTVLINSDGKELTVIWEKQSQSPASVPPKQNIFIGNVNSKKVHLPICPGLPAEKNQILFFSYAEALEAGYSPCGQCQP